MLKILYASFYLGLSVAIAAQFIIEMCSVTKNLKKNLPLFKVVQGHRCWYLRKTRQRCLLWRGANLRLSATVFPRTKASKKGISF